MSLYEFSRKSFCGLIGKGHFNFVLWWRWFENFVFQCRVVCVCVCVCVCMHTGNLWTFSCQNLTICVVINVLSSRPCALDIEMRTEMPEGRGKKKSQTARLFGSNAVAVAGSGNFCKRPPCFQPGAPSANEGVIGLCYFMVQKQIRSAASALPW